MKVQAVIHFSNPGTRPVQEDYALVQAEKGVFAIADGFGGPVAGVAAAKTACKAVEDFLIREAKDRDATLPFELRSYFSLAGNVLYNAVIYANRKVVHFNKDKEIHERGGASLLAGFIDGDFLALANVGVCTAWLLRKGKKTALTVPRTFAKLCDPFLGEELEALPQDLKVPLIALGISKDLEPEIFETKLQPGDWLVLQSDEMPYSMLQKIQDGQVAGLTASTLSLEVVKLLNQEDIVDNLLVLLIIL